MPPATDDWGDDDDDDAGFDMDELMKNEPVSHLHSAPLPEKPISHPSCCLGLSMPLLRFIYAALPPAPALVFSVGSGSGLLESLLLKQPNPPNIVGVEVRPSSNQFLPPANHVAVNGSRTLHDKAAEASTWMFIYPRRVGLVEDYIKAHGHGRVGKVVWAGPQADWADYKGCFAGERDGITWEVDMKSADKVGGRPFEVVAVATKRVSV